MKLRIPGSQNPSEQPPGPPLQPGTVSPTVELVGRPLEALAQEEDTAGVSFSRACTGTAPQEEQAAEPPRWTPCLRRGPRRKGRCPETPPPETDARPAAHRGTHRRGTGEGHRRARAREMAPRPSSPSALIRAAGSRLGRGSPEPGSGCASSTAAEAEGRLPAPPPAGGGPLPVSGAASGAPAETTARGSGPRVRGGRHRRPVSEAGGSARRGGTAGTAPGGAATGRRAEGRGGAGRAATRSPGSSRARQRAGFVGPGRSIAPLSPWRPGSGAGVSVTTAGSGRAREKGAIERHKATFPGPRYRP